LRRTGAGYDALTPESLPLRLSRALAARGEIGSLFARFLIGRVDLLAPEFVKPLSEIPFDAPPITRERFAELLVDEFAADGEILARGLDPLPCWSIPGRCAYRTVYRDAQVVIQFPRPVPSKDAVREFARILKTVDAEAAQPVVQPAVLRQFEDWLYVIDPPEKEHAYLSTLSNLRCRTHADYPMLISRFSSSRVLCWPWVEGEPLVTALADATPELSQKLAEAMLEQICVLSTVEGVLDMRAMALSTEGRIVIRRITRPLVVPIGRTQAVLRYLAAILSENTPEAAHWILQLAGRDSAPQQVSQLLGAVAAMQPNLVRRTPLPPSAAALEGSWRALCSLQIEPPLFLNFLHRNLIAAGSWHVQDSLREAHAAVLGTMLRNSLSDLTRDELAGEWAMGAGMVLLEAWRLILRIAGDLRDGNLTPRYEPRTSETAGSRNRFARQAILSAMLVVAFLACVRWGQAAPQPWSGVLLVLAALSSLALFWSVWRIG
jgi:hypothetical protein